MIKVKNYAPNQSLVSDLGCTVLYSYEKPVALIVGHANRAYKTDRYWSVTTSRHINQWLRGEGFDPKNTEEVLPVAQDTLDDWGESEFV